MAGGGYVKPLPRTEMLLLREPELMIETLKGGIAVVGKALSQFQDSAT